MKNVNLIIYNFIRSDATLKAKSIISGLFVRIKHWN